MSVRATRAARPLGLPVVRDLPQVLVLVMIAGHAALFSWLSVARHHAFWTGRFDLGNMTQAAWTTSRGDLLVNTDVAGRQVSRLASHVDPILGLFAPVFWFTDSPVPLLVIQALAVSLGALPAFWLARRWLEDDRLAVAAAAVWLLYPPLQWTVVTEFHPVAFAAPLIMFAIWAAETRRDVTLAVVVVLALMTKEQVGLSIAVLGLWVLWRQRRRLVAGLLVLGGAGWSLIAVLVVIPHFNDGRASAFVDRYGELGSGPGDILRSIVSDPLAVAGTLTGHHRLTYLAALLVPLLLLPLAAPLLAAAALPDLVLNMLADWWPQYSIEFHYAAVISPYLIAAAILGLANLRAWRRPPWLGRLTARAGPLAALMVAAPLVAGVLGGPLPWFGPASVFASEHRLDQYVAVPHARALERAVALVPRDAVVSAGNHPGAHLSARRRILTFPVIDDADWVVLDRNRPTIADRVRPGEFAARLAILLARPDFALVFDEDGVMVFRRREVATG
ncbi:MAG: DUF2079 domain-containing protein [Thermoleophilia bacterium]|nr:DUF2079 domain-containing protein [Thermoleophilia bacterium]